MGTKDKRVDAYIAKSADFARPVLNHLRQLVHKVCPEVEETLKWGMPSFEYKGMMCGFASFKQHATFGFWKSAIMKDREVLLGKRSKEAMGNLGRITSMKDLPKDKIINGWIKEAMKLNDEGKKIPKEIAPKHEKKPLVVPDYFMKALNKNKKALKTFENFSPTNKKDYIEWITEAKTEETRNNRLQTAVEWISEGKVRNWKYLKK